MKILLIASHGIGDLIMLIPALKRMEFLSRHSVTILLNSKLEKELYDLVFKNLQTKIFLKEDYSNLFTKIKLIKELREENYDKILAQAGVSRLKVLLLSFFMRSFFIQSFFSFFKYKKEIIHSHKVIENFKTLSSQTGVNLKNFHYEYPTLIFPSQCKKKIDSFIKKEIQNKEMIIIGPGSFFKERHKRFAPENYSKVILKILKKYTNFKIILVGSKNEYKDCALISRLSDDKNVINTAGKFSLTETIYLLKQSKVIIANCNAISHIGALLSKPIIGIYGPTDYKITGPHNSKFYPVSINLECSPCYQDIPEGCGNPVCMSQISPELVFENIEKCLKEV